jgi:hypothetical protein
LRGGEDRVQEVWGGLRAFEREAEGLKDVVIEREEEVKSLVMERRRIREEIERAREMIAWEMRVRRLEERLVVRGRMGRVADGEDTESEEEDTEDDEDEEEQTDGEATTEDAQVTKLTRRVQDYNVVEYLADEIGAEHPFVVAQRPRVLNCRDTILLDLSNGLRQTSDNSSIRLDIMSLYNSMDAAKEATDVLQTLISK